MQILHRPYCPLLSYRDILWQMQLEHCVDAAPLSSGAGGETKIEDFLLEQRLQHHGQKFSSLALFQVLTLVLGHI